MDQDGTVWRRTKAGRWRLWENAAHRAARKTRQRDRILTQLASATMRLAAHHGSQPPWPLDGLDRRQQVEAVNTEQRTAPGTWLVAPRPEQMPRTKLQEGHKVRLQTTHDTEKEKEKKENKEKEEEQKDKDKRGKAAEKRKDEGKKGTRKKRSKGEQK